MTVLEVYHLVVIGYFERKVLKTMRSINNFSYLHSLGLHHDQYLDDI